MSLVSFRPLLKHEIIYAEIMKINLIPYIGHFVINCINECESKKQKAAY